MNLVVVVLQEPLASFPVRWLHQVECLEYLRKPTDDHYFYHFYVKFGSFEADFVEAWRQIGPYSCWDAGSNPWRNVANTWLGHSCH